MFYLIYEVFFIVIGAHAELVDRCYGDSGNALHAHQSVKRHTGALICIFVYTAIIQVHSFAYFNRQY